METFAEERTRLVRETCLALQDAYRKLHDIGDTDIYYHVNENIWRPDYIPASIHEEYIMNDK